MLITSQCNIAWYQIQPPFRKAFSIVWTVDIPYTYSWSSRHIVSFLPRHQCRLWALMLWQKKTICHEFTQKTYSMESDTTVAVHSLYQVASNITMNGNAWCHNSKLGCFTNTSQAPKMQNSLNCFLLSFDKIMMHLSQNFAHVMTAALSWHVQNFGSNVWLVLISH